MQSLRKLPLQRAISSSLFISNRHHARYLSLARPCWNENTASKEQQSTTTTTSIEKFPWLLSQDSPRIPKYPYEEAPRDWSFLNMLPMSLQHVLGKWLGTRILQLNTGYDNFPEQFLVGASLASRQAVSLLSDQINHQNKMEELQHILGPDLLHRYLDSVPANTNIHIDIPQIYDVNLGDIWITLGNSNAFSDERKYDVLRWMTVQIGLHKYKGKSELEESFQEYRERIAKSILEGVQVGVDVLVDADVTYKATDKENNDNVILYDQGRRTLRMRFATPYFEPASKMVSGRDKETGEPINDWNWRLVDIDQLLEKEAMDAAANDE
ncbi:hypothetical protein V8B55DRAFT_1463166 [Mucor lusitanicus]|uniref:Uncharacterized protein n=2 Tax=Mucor circinelloides f. lusitanicus TaxID=29924 RepID=A0A162YZN3_MUCCL|nr:hypothetical protein FB192DRAFT_1317801 [Mucor lusitanicus]OAD01537.1 hypothetical protein MUCCIDRAFT_165410 [Mucor lusitanicus CBS 277.49]